MSTRFSSGLSQIKVRSWSTSFVKSLTTNVSSLKRLYSFGKYRPYELLFLSSSMNILASSIGTLDNLILNLLSLEFSRIVEKSESGTERGKKDSHNNVLRTNTLTTKILDRFLLINSRNYFSTILKEPIHLVISGKLKSVIDNIEIDDRKLIDAEKKKKDGNEGGMMIGCFPSFFPKENFEKLKKRCKKQATQNALNLKKFVEVFSSFVFSSDAIAMLPLELKIISKYIFDFSERYKINALPRIGGLLLLRGLNPMILFPEKLGLIEREQITPQHRRALMLITKIIQCLSNRSKSREGYMRVFDPYIENLQKKCDYFLTQCHASLTKKQIEEKKKLQYKLKSTNVNTFVFNEVALFLYNFLLSVGVFSRDKGNEKVQVVQTTATEGHMEKYIQQQNFFYGKLFYVLVVNGNTSYEEEYMLDNWSIDVDDKVIAVFRAEHAYKKQHSDEMSFDEGEIIMCYKKDVGGKSWHFGKINERQGLFPEPYVAELKDYRMNVQKEIKEKVFDFVKTKFDRDEQKHEGSEKLSQELFVKYQTMFHYKYDEELNTFFWACSANQYSKFISIRMLRELRDVFKEKTKDEPLEQNIQNMKRLVKEYNEGKYFKKKQLETILDQIKGDFEKNIVGLSGHKKTNSFKTAKRRTLFKNIGTFEDLQKMLVRKKRYTVNFGRREKEKGTDDAQKLTELRKQKRKSLSPRKASGDANEEKENFIGMKTM